MKNKSALIEFGTHQLTALPMGMPEALKWEPLSNWTG